MTGQRAPSSSLGDLTWRGYLNHYVFSKGLNTFFEDGNLLGHWVSNSDVVLEGNNKIPVNLKSIPGNCQARKLWPSQPQQNLKKYHIAIWSNYIPQNLPADSGACITPSGNRKYCLRSSAANTMILSDTFEDSCGNFYRGYWLVTFLQNQESMGTLASKGRTFYPKPGSQFKSEYVMGSSYQTSERDFLFLGDLLPGDLGKIRKLKSDALKEGYTMDGKIFKK